jgi:STE24 endopeptidase
MGGSQRRSTTADADRLRRCGFKPEVQRRARDYQAGIYRVAIFHRLTHLAALVLIVSFLGRHILSWLEPVPSIWLRSALYTLAVLMVPRILSLPVSWQAHRLDRTYGFVISVRAWLAFALADVLLLSTLGSVLFLPLFLPSGPGVPRVNWFNAALVYTILLQLQWLWCGRILLGYRLERASPEIQDRASALARSAKVKAPRVLIARSSHDSRATAFYFVGLAGLIERIVLSDHILSSLSPEERDAVLAHEIGHKRLAPLQVVAMYLLILFPVGMAALLVLPRVAAALDLQMGFELLPAFLVLYETYLLASAPLTHAVSRHFERRADRFAVRATGNPAAFARAMVKLYDQNLNGAAPGPLWKPLFGTHPSGVERVEHALSAAGEVSEDPH